jgi:hypothetical protein
MLPAAGDDVTAVRRGQAAELIRGGQIYVDALAAVTG